MLFALVRRLSNYSGLTRVSSRRAMSSIPDVDIPVLTSVEAMRTWRRQQQSSSRTVGFVPTMGALHDGHLDLVRRSLAGNDVTVMSIFVNPAQFAPHEDLATYPKTFDSDMRKLRAVLSESSPARARKEAVVFLPSAQEMYPSGIVQDVSEQKGTFVEVKGFSHQMEGQTRPTFFRGVATVVTKLFNVVEPTRAYFGQKDIQQALILRRLVRDLLLSHPLPSNLIIVPTHRASNDGLALSSRNAYLTPAQRPFASTLNEALRLAQSSWQSGTSSGEQAVHAATKYIEQRVNDAAAVGVTLRLDYVALTDPDTFESVDWAQASEPDRPAILAGALYVGTTRLIDNILCGDPSGILASDTLS